MARGMDLRVSSQSFWMSYGRPVMTRAWEGNLLLQQVECCKYPEKGLVTMNDQ